MLQKLIDRLKYHQVQRLCDVKVPLIVLLMIPERFIMVMHNVFLKLIKNFQIPSKLEFLWKVD